MSTQIVDNFQLNSNSPIDSRLVVGVNQKFLNKNDITYKYSGMRIWDLNDSKAYVWDGSIYISDSPVGQTVSMVVKNGTGADSIQSNHTTSTTLASGQFSLALGYNCKADDFASVSLGTDNLVKKFAGVALGHNNTSDGSGSLSMGGENIAIGNYSISIGKKNISSEYATAIGEENTSSNFHSISMGYKNISSGDKSVSIGNSNASIGNRSLGIGDDNKSNGNYSISMGKNNTSNGFSSISIGDYNITNGDISIGIGGNNNSKIYAVSLGYNNISGTGSVAIGKDNKVNKEYGISIGLGNESWDGAISLGVLNKANGYCSLSVGRTNVSNGNYSTTIGFSNTTTGFYGVAMGNLNTASEGSVAIGVSNKANGYCSLSIGNSNTSSGNYSTTFGYKNTSSGQYGVSFGLESISECYGEQSNAIGKNQIGSFFYNLQYGTIPLKLQTSGMVTGVEMRSGNNQGYGFLIPRDFIYSIKISLQATINNNLGTSSPFKNDTKYFEIKIIAKNYQVNFNNYNLVVDSISESYIESGSLNGLSVEVKKSNNNRDYLNIFVKSTHNRNITWFAKVEYTRIQLSSVFESTNPGS